jgi:hypothetical protein
MKTTGDSTKGHLLLSAGIWYSCNLYKPYFKYRYQQKQVLHLQFKLLFVCSQELFLEELQTIPASNISVPV